MHHERVRATVEAPDVVLHTPALCGVEVTFAVRRAVLAGTMREERARQALDDCRDLPITRHQHDPLLGRIFDLRNNFSAYDAAYAALAEVLDAELLTTDAPFAKAVGTHLGIRALPE